MPAAWEEEIERREGNGPLERVLAEAEGAEGRGRKKRKKRERRGDACATERVETKCTGIHVYIGGTRDAEGSQRGQREARDERREGSRDGGKKRGRAARQGEILTLEMRELPRVCGVRNFLAIYRRRGGKGERVRGRGGEGVKGDAEYQRRERSTNERTREKEEGQPKGEAGQNNGIVTRLWMGASMKPMVCKTPRESA